MYDEPVACAGAGTTASGAGVLTLGCAAAPDLTCTVVSSRKDVWRASDRVPYQPDVGSQGSARCKACKTDSGGIKGDTESFDDLGRKDARIVKDSIIF